MTFEKKVYTMEDNVKSITFTFKDLVKELQELNATLALLVNQKPQKKDDDNSIPF